MADPRVAEHAKVLVNHSCKVKRGDYVVVLAGAEAIPLVREIAAEVGRAGGYLNSILVDDSITRAYMMAADDETLGKLPRQVQQTVEGADVLIEVRSASNTKELGDVPPHKLMLNGKAMGPLVSIINEKRWNVTLHPTPALAQEAGKSLEAFSDFVYRATLVDWPALGQKMQVLADRMARAKEVRILGKETDISLSIEGRKPIVDIGEKNLPGGEVFTTPVEESVNGTVYFDLPIIYQGQEVKGARLTFRDGRVAEHSAEAGAQLLDGLLQVDDGASRLGELGIGMNRSIADFSKNILFDEKMGDTIHMAIGLGFPEAGGKNVSAIHIDMIKGMKEGGAIYFDGDPVYSGGKFEWE